MKVILEITEGPSQRRKLWLREHQTLSVGRTQKADFVIGEDAMVSSRHFSLECSESECRLIDLASTNGTFVNDHRVTEAPLADGDIVGAGGTKFLVTVDLAAARRPPPSTGSPSTVSSADMRPTSRPPDPGRPPRSDADLSPVDRATEPSQQPPVTPPPESRVPRPAPSPPPRRPTPPSEPPPERFDRPAGDQSGAIGEPDATSSKLPPPHLAVDPYRPRPEFQPPNRERETIGGESESEQSGKTSLSLIPDWKVELYQEFVAGAAFVYSERLEWIGDPELTWTSVDELEIELAAFLDGLTIGGDDALFVCQSLLDEGALDDPGMANAITRIFLRRQRRDLLDRALQGLDMDNAAIVAAVSNAMRDDFPTQWHDALQKELPHAPPQLIQIASKLVTSRGLEAAGDVIRATESTSVGTLPQMLLALGRLRDYRAHDSLMSSMSAHDNPVIRRSSAIAMLCLGAPHIVGECLLKVKTDDWPLMPIGLGGGPQCTKDLLLRAEKKPHRDCLLALGLLGEVSAVNALWAALGNEELAPAAALALHLLTGAELFDEEAPLAEDAEDEDEPEEPAAETPDEETEQTPDAEDAGEPTNELFLEDESEIAHEVESLENLTASCVTHSQVAWQQWWQGHRQQFKAGQRYRMGQPFSPECLIQQIEAERTPNRIRQLAFYELVIRYSVEFPFDPELTVARQRQILREMDDWVRAYGKRFEPGLWYFGGQVMD